MQRSKHTKREKTPCVFLLKNVIIFSPPHGNTHMGIGDCRTRIVATVHPNYLSFLIIGQQRHFYIGTSTHRYVRASASVSRLLHPSISSVVIVHHDRSERCVEHFCVFIPLPMDDGNLLFVRLVYPPCRRLCGCALAGRQSGHGW